MLLKENKKLATNNSDEKDVMSDIRYISKSCSLITEALQKGCDVIQMPNGDIIINEPKIVTFQYSWDDKKGKLIRIQTGHKIKKPRKKGLLEDSFDSESIEEDETV